MSACAEPMRELGRALDRLPGGERPLVEYLAALAPELWDADCEATASFLLDIHRPLLPDPGAPLPPPERDIGIVAPAAERVRRRAESWAQGRSFAARCLATLENEGAGPVVLVKLAHWHPRLIDELRSIPGYRHAKTFKEHTKVALFPASSAAEVVKFCRRHAIAPAPALEAAAGPVGEQLDAPADPDITLCADGRLAVRFPFSWAAVQEMRRIPGRRNDQINRAVWYVPAAQLTDVVAFAQRWELQFAPGVLERARAAR